MLTQLLIVKIAKMFKIALQQINIFIVASSQTTQLQSASKCACGLGKYVINFKKAPKEDDVQSKLDFFFVCKLLTC